MGFGTLSHSDPTPRRSVAEDVGDTQEGLVGDGLSSRTCLCHKHHTSENKKSVFVDRCCRAIGLFLTIPFLRETGNVREKDVCISVGQV